MTREESPDLNDEYGGFNMKDDAPAFDDPEMLSEFVQDPSYSDRFANDADVLNEDRLDRERLFLMITWGNLHRDEGITHRTDWSGSLSIDPGAIVLKQVIRFESNDRILERTQRNLLEWESVTRPAFDGILVRIVPVSKDNLTDVASEPGDAVIRFDTDPLEVEFKVSQLANLHRVITLDDGNAVAFNVIKLSPSACPHGPIRGVWANHPERQGGFFFGKWSTSNGHIRGHIKGIWGVNDEGKNVFYGKMIDMSGRFEGIVRGEWGRDPERESGGWYAGRWVDRNLRIRGRLRGHWERSAHCNGGFFRGEWAKKCESNI
jgi:hypothetical protein